MKTQPSQHHHDAHVRHLAKRQAATDRTPLPSAPIAASYASATTLYGQPSAPSYPFSKTAKHDIVHAAQERLDRHQKNILNATVLFLTEKDELMETFHVKFAREDSFEWGNLIWHALDLAGAIFLGPEAGVTGEAVKQALEIFGQAKETVEAGITKHEGGSGHEDEVRDARIALADYAKHLVKTLQDTTEAAIDAARKLIPSDIDTFDSLMHLRPVADYEEPSGWAVACDGIGITDPSTNNVTDKLYLELSSKFAGALAAVQVETELEVPRIKEHIKLLQDYLEYDKTHVAGASDERDALFERLKDADLASGNPSRIDYLTFGRDLQDLQAKLAEIELKAEQASSKAQADTVEKEEKHPAGDVAARLSLSR